VPGFIRFHQVYMFALFALSLFSNAPFAH
jgi:hypothetical protein